MNSAEGVYDQSVKNDENPCLSSCLPLFLFALFDIFHVQSLIPAVQNHQHFSYSIIIAEAFFTSHVLLTLTDFFP